MTMVQAHNMIFIGHCITATALGPVRVPGVPSLEDGSHKSYQVEDALPFDKEAHVHMAII
jgi:hypothetical protein